METIQEKMRQLAKAVIAKALFDCVKIPEKGFNHQSTFYIDSNDRLLFSKLSSCQINVELLEWFESRSRARFSYLYWLGYAGLNPNAIRNYIKKLRDIANGCSLPDDVELEIDRYAEPEPSIKVPGYLPYVRTRQHGKKWMNV